MTKEEEQKKKEDAAADQRILAHITAFILGLFGIWGADSSVGTNTKSPESEESDKQT